MLAATMILVVASAAFAQQDVGQELQLFNSLPPAQQQAVLQQLGIGGGGALGMTGGLGGLGGIGGAGSGLGLSGGLFGNGMQNSSQAMLLQQQLLQQQRRQQGLGGQLGLVSGLKPGDTVLVDINLPRPSSPASAAPAVVPGQLGLAALGTSAPSPQTSSPFTNPSSLSGAQLAELAQLASTQNGASTAPMPTPQPVQAGPGPQPTGEPETGEQQRLQDLVKVIAVHNPYQLDTNGQLLLPGIPPIPLAGLTEDLATRRVAAEPALAHLQIHVTRLPLEKVGAEGLKPFGYDLFDNSIVSFLPALNIPVPADYVIGPGDILQVQLYGNLNGSFNLIVSRDGHINFPQLGPIDVAGRRYSEAKSDIENRVAHQMIGEHANVSMGETRTINVFVLGAAKFPGSYTISGLATVTTALFAGGGVDTKGSLRHIEVKRQGETIRQLDLYDLLMRGDSSNDIKLLPGDVVFIPPVGSTASLGGAVLRPAIYELKGNQTAADLIQMGGGLAPDGDHTHAELTRFGPGQGRVVLDVNPSAINPNPPPLENGDVLQVPSLLPQLVSGVTLQGYIYRPRNVAWHSGLRLTEVIPFIDELKPDADQHYLLVRRELPPNHRIAVFSADLAAALANPGSMSDIVLMPRDIVTVFDLKNSRQYVIQPLMDELQLQSDLSQPTEVVHIEGRVKVPGDYPLEPGMRVSDLLRAGGGLEPSAYSARAELSRYDVLDGAEERTEVVPVDLNAVRSGRPDANLVLRAFDRLSVKEISGWTQAAQITLKGEVRFPGTYVIQRGETLRSVIDRAGGLTDLAFPDGAVFTRVELKQQEQEQLDRLAERMRMNIAEMALMATRAGLAGSESAITIGQSLLSQLQAAKAVGRLVINLEAVMHAKPGSSNDLLLRDGDQLIVPKRRQDVMVLGEVQDTTSLLYHPGLTRDDYIQQSGGTTSQADRAEIYVVRADGSVVTGNRGWFTSGGSVQIRPGDAIVVPLNVVSLPALTLWQQSTSILYNLAIAAAAVHAL